MRVLVVDDQVEFVASIRPALSRAGFRSFHASDLAAVQPILVSHAFDLVLVDLQMPPGHWGGLEVIKLVRHLDDIVPVIVVSGKGSLAECISAVRLGANDYIRKEAFDNEFTDRVVPLYKNAYAIEGYPSLVGYLYRSFCEEQQEYAKARRLIDVFESVIRVLTVLVIAGECQRTKNSIEALLDISNLSRPSLGSYVSFLFSQLPLSSSGHVVEAIRTSDFTKLRGDCDDFVTCRNEFGHSAVFSPQRSLSIVSEFEPKLIRILNSVAFMRMVHLIVAESLRFVDGQFSVVAKLLRGSNLQHRSITLSFPVPLTTGHVSAIHDSCLIADLFPLLDIAPHPAGDLHVYKLYNKIGKRGIDYELIPKV